MIASDPQRSTRGRQTTLSRQLVQGRCAVLAGCEFVVAWAVGRGLIASQLVDDKGLGTS
jgi:hypothetical protein